MKRFWVFSVLFLWGAMSFAQNFLEREVSISFSNLTLEEALYTLSDQTSINLAFSNEILPKKVINLKVGERSIRSILTFLLKDTELGYRQIGQTIVIFRKAKPPVQKFFTISGFLEDAKSGERLISANIFDQKSKRGTITNEYGFFSLTLPAGEAKLIFSYLGYRMITKEITLEKNIRITISLEPSLTLSEILVTATDSLREELPTGASLHYLDIGDVKKFPKLVGETDLIRTSHLLPGVQTGTDGVGGVFVRGGNLDQNLILIDGVPVYNISHAAGVFSIFNSNAIRSAKLLKGGFPARYGGRLSSVLDIRMKEGNLKEFKASGDLGLLTGQLSLEGPLIKGKSSFFLSGRGSFLDWYLQPATSRLKEERGEEGTTSYKFYDINAKFNYKISNKDKIYLSLYNGSDRFANDGRDSDFLAVIDGGQPFLFQYDQSYEEGLDWGNTVGAFRWNHLFSDKLFANTTLTFSRLNVSSNYITSDSLVFLGDPESTILEDLNFGRFESSIEDVGGRIDFDYIPSPKHYLRFGVNVTRHIFNPGVLSFDETTEQFAVEGTVGNDQIRSLEYVAYIEDEIKWSPKFLMNVGVHALNLNVGNVTYRSIQPRLSTYWRFLPIMGFKASFGRMTQHLHLLSRSSLGLPTDLWVSSTSKIGPQEAWTVTSGFDLDLGKKLSFSVEGYYKQMDNLLTYTEGANFLNNWEENVTVGEGLAYGVEFMLRKKVGRTTGWIAYTWAKADRKFEKVNLGRRFPFQYDRRHDFKIVLSHQFSKWLEFSSNWIFNTGFAYSLPLEKYVFRLPGEGDPVVVESIDGKNQFRMPNYHRLDLSVNFYFQTKNLKHTINAGVYNLYNRRNPLYFDVRTRIINVNNEFREVKELVEVPLLTILPSLRYSVNF